MYFCPATQKLPHHNPICNIYLSPVNLWSGILFQRPLSAHSQRYKNNVKTRNIRVTCTTQSKIYMKKMIKFKGKKRVDSKQKKLTITVWQKRVPNSHYLQKQPFLEEEQSLQRDPKTLPFQHQPSISRPLMNKKQKLYLSVAKIFITHSERRLTNGSNIALSIMICIFNVLDDFKSFGSLLNRRIGSIKLKDFRLCIQNEYVIMI